MQSNPLAKSIIRRYKALLNEQNVWRTSWQEIAEYLVPQQSKITTQRTRGSKSTEKLFDSTAVHSSKILSASIHASLTNQAIRWFSFKMREPELNKNHDVAVWLEEVTNRILKTIRQSNFTSEIQEVYQDITTYGTGAILVEDSNLGGFFELRFTALQLGDFVIGENSEGIVDTIMRKYHLTVRTAIEKFGAENLPKDIIKHAEKDPDKRISFVHAIFPRKGKEKNNGADVPASELPIASVHVAVQGDAVVRESGFHEFPAPTPRWSKLSGEVYGRSPAWTALPDIKSLNRLKQLELKALAKVVDPPIIVEDDGVIGSIDTRAGQATVVRDGSRSLGTFPTNQRFDVVFNDMESLKTSIREIFFVEQIRALATRSTPQMTATEVEVKLRLLQETIGSAFGRIESELLTPLIDRVFGLMFRAGELPEPPQILLANDSKIDITYEGQLQRAQRNQDIVAIESTFQIALNMAQAEKSVLHNINFDKSIQHVADVKGYPKHLMNSEEEIQAIREAEVKALESQQKQESAEGTAKALGQAAPAIEALAGRLGGGNGRTPNL